MLIQGDYTSEIKKLKITLLWASSSSLSTTTGKIRQPNEHVFVAALFSPYPFWYSFIGLFVHLNYTILVDRDNPKDVLYIILESAL